MANEDATSAQAAAMGATSSLNGGSQAASRTGTPASRMSPAAAPVSSFRAVNSAASNAINHSQNGGSPAIANQQRGNSSDQTPPASNAAVAQVQAQTGPPQTGQTSISVASPQVDMADITYGTRSRNRTNARPNYAEDQDMDFEYSSAATTAGTASKKRAAELSASTGSGVSEAKRGPEFTSSFQAVNSTSSNGTGAAAATKESTPSNNSGTGAGTSKKRKAAGTPATSLQASVAATSTPPPAAARKPTGSASSAMARETNLMTFTKHRNCLNKKGELVADDGTKLSINDHVYLVCEPPSDPYYLCRIMEFLHVESDNPNSPVDSLRVNWYYRPRDIARFSTDTRLVFATMHSDMCPLTSLRGKCTIKHRSEIEDLDAYRKERDYFYFVQVYDRFIRRSYECIPVQQIINVPEKVKKALDERWKFVVVEIGRVKELTSAAKTCKRCARYCASSDSVDCAICKNSYHMNCVQPPLPKKPSRGFAWACGPCSRATEKKKEAHSTPTASGNGTEAEDDEPAEEEEVPAASNDTTRAPSPSGSDMVVDQHPATQAEIALAKMWPMRYLGIHARVEDALQYDDRAIYPRASSRLGPRHQANTNMWHGRPVELVKAAEIKKRYNKGPAIKAQGKLTKDTLAAIEADREEKAKRPKWVQDEPVGYVARGEDYPNDDPRNTAKLLYKMPTVEENPRALAGETFWSTEQRQQQYVQNYMQRAKPLAKVIGVPPFGTNFLDKATELLNVNKFNADAALKQLQKVDRRTDLHEPVFSKSDLAKFEEGVAKYGSEHRLVRLHMKSNLPHADIVRFYYLWKKTPKGREIWGNYGGRKKRKVESDAGAKLQAEVAHDVDDSAFDNDKAIRKNRGFQCKFCNVQHSPQWRRAPGVSPGQTAATEGKVAGKKEKPLLALCLRCARLWRKYAIQWEDVDEISKKGPSGRTFKKKLDEEHLREIFAADAAPPEPPIGTLPSIEGNEPPKKKSKMDKDGPQAVVAKKEKPPPPPKEPTPPPPPIIPAQPTWKILPCAVCNVVGDTIACSHCKLTVHRTCFGVGKDDGLRADGEVYWVCEQCQNDRNPLVSTDYSCCLCLTEETQVDLVEPPRVSHKKKTDREREKERLEKELADGMRNEYRNKQYQHNRPPIPREPLKRTTGNNWVHVYCALWTPELRFSNAKKLEVAEGFQLIPQQKYEAVCKLCKNKDHQNRVRENAGACVNCFQCQAPFHASCALEAGYTFGFDVTPVKSSRKDQVVTATLGQESGLLTAVILCKEHTLKNPIHPVNEIVDDSGKTSLQVYAETYKQADLFLTGTVRKAAQAQLIKDKSWQAAPLAQNGIRRESGTHSIAAAIKRGARTSSVAEIKADVDDGNTEISSAPDVPGERRCVKCDVDVTPKWHAVEKETEDAKRRLSITNGESTDANKAKFSEPPKQNIRFMAPGANGRAWEGMPDRYAPRAADRTSGEPPVVGAPVSTPSQEPTLPPPTQPDGEPEPAHEDEQMRDTDEGYHTHALPRFQNPAARTPPPPEPDLPKEEPPKDWLCHKCFMEKKLAPTPAPEESTERAAHVDSSNRSPKPPVQRTIEEQFEVWDKPPPPPAPVAPPLGPPMMNGYGPPPHYGPNVPTLGPHPNGYHHPYAQQPPNGYHPGPPPGHVGPPMMHDRHNSYGYQPHPSPNPAQHYGPPPPHSRPPMPMNGYGRPPNPPMSNGIPSPHPQGRPPLHSPSFPRPAQHQPQIPPSNIDPALTGDITHEMPAPPGPPLHSSPHAPFGRARTEMGNGLPQPSEPPLSMPAQQGPFLPGASPQSGSARPDGQGARPTTPRSQANGAFGPSGASASPNLMHLLH